MKIKNAFYGLAIIAVIFGCGNKKMTKQQLERIDSIKKADSISALETIAWIKAERRADSIKLANTVGMWVVKYYVDDFDEPTKSKYITSTEMISGTFSNTATQDSKLNVKFIISERDNKADIDIKLYEYAGNNPVKSYTNDYYHSDDYTVLIQDKDGKRLRLRAVISSMKSISGDRLSFLEEDSKEIHNTLIKGGTIKFRIIEDDSPTTKYRFTIENADLYESAYKILTSNSVQEEE